MTDIDLTTPAVPEHIIEDTAVHAFLAARIGDYANTSFEELPVEHQEFWRSQVRMILARALAGRTVVDLPAPTSLTSCYWKASGRTISAHIDSKGQPYLEVDGQVWLTSEARNVGLALVAATEQAEVAERRAAEEHPTRGGER